MAHLTLDNKVGNNVKYLRDNLGISQNDLADQLGVDRSYISAFENGTRRIPVKYLELMADLFGVELYQLLEEDQESLKLELAFAFRDDPKKSINEELITFKRIVKNYKRLVQLNAKQA